MRQTTVVKPVRTSVLPHIGQRIVKTSLAVFICLIIYYLRGYQGSTMQSESVITAIICMQPYVKDTREFALNRLTGTLIGAVLGLLFLLIMTLFPILGANMVAVYALMGLGTLISLHLPVLLKKADTSSLSAIVFICVVLNFPEIESPTVQAINRVLDVFIGTLVAIGLNVIRLPRRKNRNLLLFVKADDLVPRGASQLSSAALFRLNYLYDDGAKICLISEHAPALLLFQINNTKISVPLIVMDGAAIYDVKESVYLYKEFIPNQTVKAFLSFLDFHQIGCFIYTIHKNKTCIFHHGEYNAHERNVLAHMKQTHYRYYMQEEVFDPFEIIYFKIVLGQGQDDEAQVQKLEEMVHEHHLRMAQRPQPSDEQAMGYYIYSEKATPSHAEDVMVELMQENGWNPEAVEVTLSDGAHTERDALHLLTTVGNRYEPVSLFGRKDASEANE